jgi:hypothetical protein
MEAGLRFGLLRLTSPETCEVSHTFFDCTRPPPFEKSAQAKICLPALVPKEASADAEPGGLPAALTCCFCFAIFCSGFCSRRLQSVLQANQVAVTVKGEALTCRTGTCPTVHDLVASVA